MERHSSDVPQIGVSEMRKHVTWAVFTALLVPTLLMALGGCRTNAQTGALIGGAAGAAGGYMIGNETDKEEHEEHHH
jgi:branched-subunit amino acid transport protein